MKILLFACLFCLFTPVRWVLAADALSLSVCQGRVQFDPLRARTKSWT